MTQIEEKIQKYSDDTLYKIAMSYSQTSWSDDHIVRKAASDMFDVKVDDVDVTHILCTAPHIAKELARRCKMIKDGQDY